MGSKTSVGFLDLLIPAWLKQAIAECPYPYEKWKRGKPSNKAKELRKLRDEFIESKRPVENSPNIRSVKITYKQRFS